MIQKFCIKNFTENQQVAEERLKISFKNVVYIINSCYFCTPVKRGPGVSLVYNLKYKNNEQTTFYHKTCERGYRAA